jgi:hypothetical protein
MCFFPSIIQCVQECESISRILRRLTEVDGHLLRQTNTRRQRIIMTEFSLLDRKIRPMPIAIGTDCVIET